MFHCIKILFQRFVSLVVYVWEYKIILMSVLHVFFLSLGIHFLRNNLSMLTIGFLYFVFSILLFFVIYFCIAKRAKDINFINKDNRDTSERIRVGVSIFVFILLIAIFCLIQSRVVVNKEKIVSNIETGFTSGYTKFGGYIFSEPIQKHTYQNLEVRPLQDSDIKGNILIKTEKFEKFKIGDICNFSGKLSEPRNSDKFDYKNFLKNKNIYFLMEYPKIECNDFKKNYILRRSLVDIKQKIIKKVEKYLKEPQLSLFVGILMGENRLFSKSLDFYIRIAGISHIVAASGYNITILLIVSNIVLRFLPKNMKIVISITLIWLFCLLSGVSASIVRACIMASISLIGLLFGRKGSIHTVFSFCIFLFVFFKPKIIFDVGFQLSCCATGSLIYLFPSIINAFKIKTKEGFLVDTVLTTVSCTIATLPISIFTFKTFSIWSIFANGMILPVIESTMLFGVLGLLFSNKFLMFIVDLQLKYVEIIVRLIGNCDFGYKELEDGKWISIALIVFIILFSMYFYPVGDENSNYYTKIYS